MSRVTQAEPDSPQGSFHLPPVPLLPPSSPGFLLGPVHRAGGCLSWDFVPATVTYLVVIPCSYPSGDCRAQHLGWTTQREKGSQTGPRPQGRGHKSKGGGLARLGGRRVIGGYGRLQRPHRSSHTGISCAQNSISLYSSFPSIFLGHSPPKSQPNCWDQDSLVAVRRSFNLNSPHTQKLVRESGDPAADFLCGLGEVPSSSWALVAMRT